MRGSFVLGLAVSLVSPGAAPHVPDDAQKVFAIRGARIFQSPAKVLEKGNVILRDGVIEAVGEEAEVPFDAVVVPGEGLTVYPGFVDAHSHLGVSPPPRPEDPEGKVDFLKDSHPQTVATNRKGVWAELQAADCLVLSEKGGEELRKNGFTAFLAAPKEGLLAGQSAFVSLAGGPRRESLIHAPAALHASFRTGAGEGYPESLMGAIAHLRQALLDGGHHARDWSWFERHAEGARRPPLDRTLAALRPPLEGRMPVIFEASTESEIRRAVALADEFGLRLVLSGGTEAWKAADLLASKDIPVILSLDFGKEPKDPAGKKEKKEEEGKKEEGKEEGKKETAKEEKKEDEPDLPLRLREDKRRKWEERVANAAALEKAGILFAFTTKGTKGSGDFLKNLQKAMEKGLSKEGALAALTLNPARIFAMERLRGTIEAGRSADLVAMTGELGSKDAKVRHLFVDGRKFDFDEEKEPKEAPAAGVDLSSTWEVSVEAPEKTIHAALTLKQEEGRLSGKIVFPTGEVEIEGGTLSGRRLTLSFTMKMGEELLEITMKGEVAEGNESLSGTASGPMGEFPWSAARKKPNEEDLPGLDLRSGASFQETSAGGSASEAESPRPDRPVELESDRKPSTRTGGNVLLCNGTLLPVASGPVERADILIQDGRIAAIGRGLQAPEGCALVDVSGKYLVPGFIDCHSHMAIEGGVNEGTLSITAECRIGDVIDPKDVAMYRALAGGLTTAHLLHGSSNVIGGQDATIKLKYGRPLEELRIPDAPQGIKFALGENPKQSNWIGRGNRFPNTRMGVEAVLKRAFHEAEGYRKGWSAFWDARARGEDAREPRRDLRLEALGSILDRRIWVHSHCYRADEILMLMRVAEEFGWRVKTFQHVLEGYKVALELAAHGAGGSTFSDWWAYKIEAYDAIPHNGALMTEAGVVASFNSDSTEMCRRMNLEAAKGVKYGGLSEEAALALVTLNAAKQLGIDHRAGSLEVGKDGDIAVFDGHPFSVYSRCVMTLIEGEVYFERRDHWKEWGSGKRKASAAVEASVEMGKVPPPAARSDSVPIVILGGTVFPVTGDPIEGGMVVIQGERIAAVGKNLPVPEEARVVEAAGLRVYPGMIDSGTRLGLTEIGSVHGTNDVSDVGDIQPDLVAATAVNPFSEHLPVTRVNGITTAVTRPTGGLISGQGSLVRLNGWVASEMVVKDPLALYVTFPFIPERSEEEQEEKEKKEDESQKRVKTLKEIFEQAKEYGRIRDEARSKRLPPPSFDPRLDAIVPYARGEAPVVVEASRERQIRRAVKWASDLGVRMILSGGRDAWRVADLLVERKIPVLVGPVLDLPGDPNDPYDAPFHNAAVLHGHGVRFAFQTQDSSNARNLPYHAGMAAAFGLPKEEALKAVTIYPAEIFGVADRIGSIEPGKVADLIVTDGDPLEIRTQVKHLFLAGEPVALETKHTRLYAKFRERIRAKRAAATGASPAPPGD